jgi:hypothetical protein
MNTKNVEKFSKIQDLAHERKYLSESFFLIGEKILNKINPIIEVKINNFSKSKIDPIIIDKSMTKYDLISIKELLNGLIKEKFC